MNTVEILKAARELISKEENWARYHQAINADGHPVPYSSPNACGFCSIGALARVCISMSVDDQAQALHALRLVRGGGHTIAGFNDTHEHGEVLSAFDRAIARAESEDA